MPISDLLASISGDSPTPSPTTISRPALSAPKRKAADELRDTPIKAPRTESPSNGLSRTRENPSGTSSRPTDKSVGTSSDKAGLSRRPPTHLSASASRNSTTSSSGNGVKSSANTPLSKPLVNRPAKPDSAPPKKRSFAEIMARAQANSEARASFGVIQHKTVERTLTMKERKELKAEEARKMKKGARQRGPSNSGGYGGTAAPPRPGMSRPGHPNGTPGRAKSTSSKEISTPVKEEKKIKKAALATTGYTGTARPRPGAINAKPGAASRPGQGTEERERPRFGGPLSRPRRADDYDDELDDFIEYDDEEEEPGYGYGRTREYDDEDESDMEAGISDIDEEESRAERLARLEDIKEQELEKRLKREKEERRRKFQELEARKVRR